jgi:hypothetical protein
MNLIWTRKLPTIIAELRRYERISRVLQVYGIQEFPDEMRAVVRFDTPTLVRAPTGQIGLAGPVVAGIRYHQSFLSTAPHPMEIATILDPRGVHHPNLGRSGGVCLGKPVIALSMESILNQLWAAVNFNMSIVNTVSGQVVNAEAADFVRANAHRFPLRHEGLLEAEPFHRQPPSGPATP